MTPERYRRLVEVFDSVCDRSLEGRGELLTGMCQGDEELRIEVLEMLEAAERSALFLDKLPEDIAAGALAAGRSRSLIGERLGDYRVIAHIGTGGMGEVFLAEDMRLGRRAAIKLLPEEYTSDPVRLRRFEQEASAASALSHPNIVTVYGLGRAGSVNFLITEVVDGRTLREEMRGGRLTAQAVVEIAIQIASALAAAHQQGIIHRDIKPENIMLRSDGLVKILDFGLAKRTGQQVAFDASDTSALRTEPGLLVGTPRYMSPEQARGFTVDARTDLFSLGAVLYEMLAWQPAVVGNTHADVLAALLTGDPRPLNMLCPECPASLNRVVNRALEKDRDKRYQSAEEMLFDLEAVRRRIRGARLVASDRRIRTASIMAAVFGMLVLLVATWPANRVRNLRDSLLAGPGSAVIRSLAVLPLDDLSGYQQNSYFSDSITAQLSTDLSKLGTLQVIPHSSVIQYKQSFRPLGEIAGKLNVDAVLAGSVLSSGDRVRITAHVVDRQQEIVWMESHERELRDIRQLQGELAGSIAVAIRNTVRAKEHSGRAGERPIDPQAYEAFVKGRYFWNTRTESGLKKSIEYFQQAIQRDPSYARAYCGLADSYLVLGAMQLSATRDVYSKARAAAEKALKLDDSLGEAHTVLGDVIYNMEWDWAGAEREHKRAIELSPGYATAHQRYSLLLGITGRTAESLAQIHVAQSLDPLSPSISSGVAWRLFWARRYDDAVEQLQKTLQIAPDFERTHLILGWVYDVQGRHDKAIEELRRLTLSDTSPKALAALGHALAAGGHRREAEKILRKLKDRSKRAYVPNYYIATVYAGLGEKDRALEWLAGSCVQRDDELIYVKVDPLLDSLRGSPRFKKVLQCIGLPE